VTIQRTQAWLVPSASEPGKEHVVVQLTDHALACTCEGFRFRAQCRHIHAVNAYERDEWRKLQEPRDNRSDRELTDALRKTIRQMWGS